MMINNFVEQGRVLGAQIYRESAMVVQAVIDQDYRATLNTHDMRTILISLGIVLAVVVCQVIGALVRKRRGSRCQVGKWFWYVLLDLIVFVGAVVIQAYVNYKILKIEYPQQVQVERLGDSLVRVRWMTYDATLGIMSWNYEGEPSQFAIDSEGDEKRKEHEVILEVEPQKKIDFYLFVGEKKFGQSETDPYQVDAMSVDYQLEEIKTDAK
ncbi:MAG: hypothetical protein ABII80_03125 [bacterium]